MTAGKTLQKSWTAPTPEGMIYCQVLGQNITFCGMTERCHIKKCKAKEPKHDH